MSGDKNNTNGAAGALVPVPEVLMTVSDEIRMLPDGVNDLQELIGNLVVAGAFGGSHSLYELQSLDRISQSLEAISDYLGGASKISSPDWKIDVAEASRCVKIAEMSDRLNGITRDDASHNGAGDFDDFELTA
ncbi:hypothetical protein Hden_3063 [Hyphomicrobium denitrificans ATCC 51888]|uniref:Uncharacterized protein n=1 Tax=Hyphomicrobium denitrificans (strain ATCC 51888 / DSM 1869 / NCIMB 11706 / TK 0415) TaxID=582899 RepID=D8JVX9_HYPDA|nr:hypothetical protein [Hyphomicrobium denitrificans]ADJ24858.1 hypothetical protein Hden_3063 [Hyphomicrobium denitrificans ATCC 51888]